MTIKQDVADVIKSDLTDRRGLRQTIEGIDEDIQEERAPGGVARKLFTPGSIASLESQRLQRDCRFGEDSGEPHHHKLRAVRGRYLHQGDGPPA